MDGFIRRPQASTSKPISKPKPQPTTRATHQSPKVGRTTQTSQTLMRHAVHKPAHSTVPKISSKATPAEAKASPAAVRSPHHERQQRASQISKSSSISRFSAHHTSSVTKKYAPLAVKPHPEETHHHTAHRAAKPASTAHNSFEAALQNATSHQEPAHKTTKRRQRAAKKLGISVRSLNIGAISLAVVLLTGFIAYQNIPNVSMRMASAKAGFNASLPGYTPSGFGRAGSIQSSPGAVTVTFKSHSDNRNFQVSQKPSNWTSDSLLSNHVAVNQRDYQVYQDKGKTIYIYDGNNASWVNGGVWYEVTGNSSLSSEQLLRIADSM